MTRFPAAVERAKADTVSFIRTNQRLPSEVWIGSEKLSIGDFAATLAAYDGTSANAGIRRANLEFESYFSTDPKGSFNWADPPEGSSAPELARSRPAAVGWRRLAGATTCKGMVKNFAAALLFTLTATAAQAAEYLEKTVLFERAIPAGTCCIAFLESLSPGRARF